MMCVRVQFRPRLETWTSRRIARQGARRRAAFTLIELIAVISITAILAAVAVPSMTSLSANRSTIAGKQILRDISFARERAMLTGTRCWLTFNAVTDTYSVLSENPASPGRGGASVII